jgi:glycosyltransferase involved in cell wall biosynthesis
MRVAYYSPLPPERSGIADYSALLLPSLAERIDVVVARRGRLHRAPRADLALYHVGNNVAGHGWIVDELRRRPGIVVLHEFVLHHLIAGLTLERGDRDGYMDALERDAGLAGRLLAYAVIEKRIEPLWETRPQDFPLTREILWLADGLIVHSHHLEQRVRDAGFRGPVWRIPMAAWPLPKVEPAAVEGEPLYGCFGHINESKRIPQLLAAFSRFRQRRPGARLLLVGQQSERMPAFELPEGVIREERVPEDRLWALMEACDVHVCLRWPYMGETSAVAVRALSLGKPLVVSDVGWFSELPDDVALKVPPDEREPEAITAAFDALAADPVRRAAMGKAALALAESEHRLDRVADAYAAALEEAVAEAAVAEVAKRQYVEAASAAAKIARESRV